MRDLKNSRQGLKPSGIEKIFGVKFDENPRDDSLQEIIKKIEFYGASYDPNSDLSAFDQLQICEAVAESTPVKEKSASFSKIKKNNGLSNEKCNVKCPNGICKRRGSLKTNQGKFSGLLKKFEEFNYETPPKEIAAILEKFFPNSKPGHWLFIAQNYTPKTMRSRLRYMEKHQREGWETIKNPGAYLTELLKHKKKRKRRF